MAKIKLQIKNRFTGSLIFEYESDDNTISETVKEYIKKELADGKSSADLRFADLRYADLRSANLRSANLSFANLRFADLRFADLRSANLSSADLSSANLDKRYIQVSCIGSVKRMTTYSFEDDIIYCGCFKGSLDEFENQVNETHKDNEQYLKEYIGFINYLKSLK